jgi:hypothetical protein
MSSTASIPAGANDSGSIEELARLFTYIFMPLQVLCVLLRYLSRYIVRHAWGADDIMVFVSLLFQLGLGAITIGVYSVRQISVIFAHSVPSWP